MSAKRNMSSSQVADRLNSAAIHLLRVAREADKAAPVGPAQLSALSVLVFGGPRTVGQLAAAEQVRSATMSGIVAALETKGMVSREPHPTDHRSTTVHATTAGTRVLRSARERRVQAIAARLNDLPESDLATLAAAAELMERISSLPPH